MRHRRGFSLIEVLAAIVLLGVMTAIIAPAIGPRLRDGEMHRFNANVNNLRSGTTMFLMNVKTYPGRPTQFFVQPTGGTAKDLFHATISVGKANGWRGPYLDTDSLGFFGASAFGLGATVVDSFTVRTSDGNPYMALILTGLSRDDQLRYKRDFDHGTGIAGPDSATGLVRYAKDSMFILVTTAR